jgi:hypothetical protein
MEGIPTGATVLSILIKVYTIHCNDRGHINVMLVLQSCTEVMAGSSTETFPTSSDGTLEIGNIKFEEVLDIKEEEVNVKTEKSIGSEEEECINIKDEEGMYSEEEEEEKGINTKYEKAVDMKEEVSWEEIVYMFACPLLDPFKQYVEISVVFGLSICSATTNTCTVGHGVCKILIRRKVCK